LLCNPTDNSCFSGVHIQTNGSTSNLSIGLSLFKSDYMQAVDRKEICEHDMHDFGSGRTSDDGMRLPWEDAYKVFFKYFVKCVTRISVWEKNLKTATTDGELCTVSDEAFALLLLENSWSRWIDIYRKDPEALYPRCGSKQVTVSNVPTMYTKGGIKYQKGVEGQDPDKSQATRNHKKGWGRRGVERYNELFKMVEANRMLYPKWILGVILELRAQQGEKKKLTGNK
jgi:hypothetical protein